MSLPVVVSLFLSLVLMGVVARLGRFGSDHEITWTRARNAASAWLENDPEVSDDLPYITSTPLALTSGKAVSEQPRQIAHGNTGYE
jgi:hypothetical protein